ncbi:MAG: family 43 glycosylhydrolase [Selenomonas sp.]|uniref:glycoside hydrolase family 43 protein n=1 Tax=Selenomonas sp. TaxID=2053611 RepID=UPI0025E265F6|nr:family 43 glycosylhydrolase [Selenomonas sp.]MCR5757970.1 family 43 glycosylhydrolase [Selenomonas sp.]
MVKSYPNPLVFQRADPFIYKHTDGYYYFTASVPEYDRIEIRRAKSLADLEKAEPFVAWEHHDHGEMSSLIWAPEIHYLQGAWYIYFAAAPNDQVTGDTFNHRMYVLENKNANPLTPHWEEKGQLITGWESFALDATVLEHKDRLYYIWAQEDKEVNEKSHSNLYIAAMKNPWTLESSATLLTQPEYDWETQIFWVNEGPSVIKKNGHIFLTYSASATDENYCLGMLIADEDADLLNPDSWHKSEHPVFGTSYDHHIYGPGHNSFTVSEDGKTDLLVYHARDYNEIEGDPLYDPNRHTRVQPIHWRADGMPDFGEPIPETRFLDLQKGVPCHA